MQWVPTATFSSSQGPQHDQRAPLIPPLRLAWGRAGEARSSVDNDFWNLHKRNPLDSWKHVQKTLEPLKPHGDSCTARRLYRKRQLCRIWKEDGPVEIAQASPALCDSPRTNNGTAREGEAPDETLLEEGRPGQNGPLLALPMGEEGNLISFTCGSCPGRPSLAHELP